MTSAGTGISVYLFVPIMIVINVCEPKIAGLSRSSVGGRIPGTTKEAGPAGRVMDADGGTAGGRRPSVLPAVESDFG